VPSPITTPAEAVTISSRPWRRNGWSRLARSRSTIQILEEDDELVTAEPGQGVPRPQRSLQPAGHLDQQLVAGGVTQAVVHDLEPVEVEEDEGVMGRATGDAGLGVAQPIEEQRPVRQIGDGIVERLVGEALLEPGVGQSGGGHRGQRLEHEAVLVVEDRSVAGGHLDGGGLVEGHAEAAGFGRNVRIEQCHGLGREQFVGGPDEFVADGVRVDGGPDGGARLVEPFHLAPLPVLAEGPPVGELQHGDGNDGGDEDPAVEFDGGGDEHAERQRASPCRQPHTEAVPQGLGQRGALGQCDDPGHGQHGQHGIDEDPGHRGERHLSGEVAGAGAQEAGHGGADGGGGRRLPAVERGAHPAPPVPEVPDQAGEPDRGGHFGSREVDGHGDEERLVEVEVLGVGVVTQPDGRHLQCRGGGGEDQRQPEAGPGLRRADSRPGDGHEAGDRPGRADERHPPNGRRCGRRGHLFGAHGGVGPVGYRTPRVCAVRCRRA
jgi:hypothetical protein